MRSWAAASFRPDTGYLARRRLRRAAGEWRLDSIELGRCDCDRADEIDLVLGLLGDDAQWTIRFRIAPLDVNGFFAIEFRRRFM